jgi:hypothetical protein
MGWTSVDDINYQIKQMLGGVVNDRGESGQALGGQPSTYPPRGPRIAKAMRKVKRREGKLKKPNPLYACSFRIQLVSKRWFLSELKDRELLDIRLQKIKRKEDRDKVRPLEARIAVRYKVRTLCWRIKCLSDKEDISKSSAP